MSERNGDEPRRRSRGPSSTSDDDVDVKRVLGQLADAVGQLISAAETNRRLIDQLSIVLSDLVERSGQTAELLSKIGRGIWEQGQEAGASNIQIAELLSKIERRLSASDDRHEEAERGQSPAAQVDTDKSSDDEMLETIAKRAAYTGDIDLRQMAPQIAASDVVRSVEDFHTAASTLAVLQQPYPMVELASVGWAPLDLGNSARLSGPGSRARVSPGEVVDLARRAPEEAGRMGMRFNTMPVPQARTIFATLLARFLRPRTETAPSRRANNPYEPPHQGSPQLPGLEVVVHTNRPRLRIFYAPIYFPATRLVFGNSLSTPVRGYLDPGIYIFGAEGTGVTIFEDNAPRRIPPDHDIHMLQV